jgi:hypothetical protein
MKISIYWCKHPNISIAIKISHPHGVHCDMTQPLLKLQLSQPFFKKKLFVEQDLHESG